MVETAFWILTALAGGRRHGYAILHDVEQLSGGSISLKVTTLYASLERLTREGRVSVSGEEVVDGRARRYYEITPQGVLDLETEAQRLEVRVAVAKERTAALRAGAPRAATAMVVPA